MHLEGAQRSPTSREKFAIKPSERNLFGDRNLSILGCVIKSKFLLPGPPPRQNPCSPSPCGPNSQCRVNNDQAVCTCLPNYVGSPPSCRPECVVSSECPSDRACINNKCSDPCPNTCGIGAHCTTKNHNPICACPAGQTGDPFTRCSPIREFRSV